MLQSNAILSSLSASDATALRPHLKATHLQQRWTSFRDTSRLRRALVWITSTSAVVERVLQPAARSINSARRQLADVRAKSIFRNGFNVIFPVQSRRINTPVRDYPNHPYNSPHPVPVEGRWPSSRRGAGCGGRGSVGRAVVFAGRASVRERTQRADDRRQCLAEPLGEVGRLRTAKPCGPVVQRFPALGENSKNLDQLRVSIDWRPTPRGSRNSAGPY